MDSIAKSRKRLYGGADLTEQLFLAINNASETEVTRLIAEGANVTEINPATGTTPMYAASLYGHTAIVEKLIAAGADVNKKTTKGFIPLHAATQYGKEALTDILIAAGADIDKQTSLGSTSLYLATYEGHTAIVEKLIAAGADVNKAANKGTTPIYTASYEGHTAIVEKLITAGADVNKTNEGGFTPLHAATQYGKEAIMDLLIAAGADVNKQVGVGLTSLYLATYEGHTAIVEKLIAAGADVNKTNNFGSTPLHVAVNKSMNSIVEKLLAAGADTRIRDNKGKRPIDFAKTHEMRNLLKSSSSLKWHGWTRGDASKLDGIFGDDETARNFALCPVCMKYVIRSDACMYMSHNCSTSKGYYHEQLYLKYKNSLGVVNWCTICGRICKGHNHYELSSAQGKVPDIIYGRNHFALSCETEGGGGVTEKLLRFRRLREHARDLQAEVGVMGWWEAMDELCEEMWNAPIVRSRALKTMQTEKKFNISNTNFPLTLPPTENAPNIPYMGEMPLVHPTEAGIITNAIGIDDSNIIQFRHKKADGTINNHDGRGQQISREAFIGWLKAMLENPTGEEFAKCWQYKTRSQQAPLSEDDKALVCDATLHPKEVKAALDMADPEQARLAEGYRKAFNAAMDVRKIYR